MPEAAVSIPRPLANRLLHLAQSAPDRAILGLIGAAAGVPASCYPVTRGDGEADPGGSQAEWSPAAALRRMQEQGERLFAVFQCDPRSPAFTPPPPLDPAIAPETLYLSVFLNIRGVLELRGFRTGPGGTTREVELFLDPGV